MLKFILAIILIVSIKPNDTLRSADRPIDIVGEVIYANNMPRYGTLCQNTEVHSAAMEESTVLYELQAGDVVRLRDKSRGHALGWIMIKPAQWIRGEALCPRGE